MQIKKYTINHVMSKDIDSGIFAAILRYFRENSPEWVDNVESVEPLEEADVYHYHRPHLETKLRKNSVCTVHHDLDDPDIWHARQRFIPRYNESSAVICLNETQKKILINEEGVKEEKIFVVPHGYNNKILSPIQKEKNRQRKFTLGIASRRYGRRVKGEAYLSELIKRLDPDLVKFLLVGQDRSIDAVDFRRYGFEIEVFERLPYRLFQSFYSEIDALLMCSSHEGGPANIPEAMATGTPVFSSPIGMSLDFIKHGDNGFFLTLDPDIDANLIMKYATDNMEFELVERRCLSQVTTIPTWGDSVRGNLDAYSKIIGANIFEPIYLDVLEDENIQEESLAIELEAVHE
ncbi:MULTISPECIES: glycosyltransferase family 4 protein [Comamonas]|uniref:glycosyltransferase family 4 protein n=1 Tax=Comamonas TaxID=283 RepID=UPI0009B91F94|nr:MULTISPECIES: glycosyltransferase family 4 protein [Comamonas]TZG09487.1 glycosyltransferase family 4 protein [Comamonas thiooxydans]UNV92920.1 glycosyltransferase family 4 protein [Comamonas sp. 7D-2evo1]UNV93778.1 glycosyltransferase family 4 protein [Comamonas sp. 7D-2]UNW02559.1 glycosyltransferase family 4 protein [Comamonas sp. 7D-2evo2]